jgi:hypothetical protein
MNDWKSGTSTRRDFLGTTLGAAAGFSIYPTGHRLLREILEPASNTFTPFQFPKNFLWGSNGAPSGLRSTCNWRPDRSPFPDWRRYAQNPRLQTKTRMPNRVILFAPERARPLA